MRILVAPFIRPKERTLQRIRVHNRMFSVHDYPSCGFLSFLDVESASFEVEVLTVFTHEVGEDAFSVLEGDSKEWGLGELVASRASIDEGVS